MESQCGRTLTKTTPIDNTHKNDAPIDNTHKDNTHKIDKICDALNSALLQGGHVEGEEEKFREILGQGL